MLTLGTFIFYLLSISHLSQGNIAFDTSNIETHQSNDLKCTSKIIVSNDVYGVDLQQQSQKSQQKGLLARVVRGLIVRLISFDV